MTFIRLAGEVRTGPRRKVQITQTKVLRLTAGRETLLLPPEGSAIGNDL